MSALARGFASSVGLKFVSALTGLLLLLFVVGHMLGNLQVFLGPDALNAYAAKLQGLGGLLWIVRSGLLVVFLLHFLVGAWLWLVGRRARPVAYAQVEPIRSTLPSRTMIWTGVLVLAFLSYHLLHFTFHATNPSHAGALDAHGRSDVFRMVVLGFQDPAIASTYVLAMLFLGLHLWHGASSLFQSMGWRAPRYERLVDRLGVGLAAVLVLGNVAMPLSVLFGLVGLPAGGN